MKPLRISSNQDAQKLKLEMEEFRDLTAYLPNSPKVALNSVDELNTPIFGEYSLVLDCFFFFSLNRSKKQIDEH